MQQILALRELLEPHDLTFFGDAPYVYHCHHYNLFHDQTVDDVLGEELGFIVRRNAAQAAFGQLLEGVYKRVGAQNTIERAEIAQALFAAAGHGQLTLSATQHGGKVTGTHLHYGYAWKQKYGERVRRFEGADAFAAGAASAATALAHGLPLEALTAIETKCLATRDASCEFELSVNPVKLEPIVDRAGYERQLGHSEGGLHEEKVSTIAAGLQSFLRGVGGDERGLVDAFGVYATMHLANYYNETAHSALRHAKATRSESVQWVEALLREAGHVCVFHTFGGILSSPEWEGMVGPFSGDPLEVIQGCCAIARGLGFGRWTIKEFIPNERLVVHASSTYEGPWFLERYGQSETPSLYFFQGAVLAWAVLAHRVAWAERPELSSELYRDLFQGPGGPSLGWKLETPEICVTTGQKYSEVVITKT